MTSMETEGSTDCTLWSECEWVRTEAGRDQTSRSPMCLLFSDQIAENIFKTFVWNPSGEGHLSTPTGWTAANR